MAAALGFDCELHEVAPDRPNLVAHRDGTGGVVPELPRRRPPAARPPRSVDRPAPRRAARSAAASSTRRDRSPRRSPPWRPSRDTRACVVITVRRGGRRPRLGARHASRTARGRTTAASSSSRRTSRSAPHRPGNIDVRVEVSAEPTHAYAPEAAGLADQSRAVGDRRARHVLVPQGGAPARRTSAREHRTSARRRAPVADARSRAARDDARRRPGDRPRGRRRTRSARAWTISRGAGATAGRRSCSTSPTRASRTTSPPTTCRSHERSPPRWTFRSFRPGCRRGPTPGFLYTKHRLPCVVFGAGELASGALEPRVGRGRRPRPTARRSCGACSGPPEQLGDRPSSRRRRALRARRARAAPSRASRPASTRRHRARPRATSPASLRISDSAKEAG